ncbi:MAG: class I SAM-dependent methyltransferase [Deltaproteobacteria bacterium]|nr:class I SAM-dependent methyltransferase [Deltaproteobacteria bacterium]
MNFKDLFSQQAADYSKFRPTYPPELFAYLAEFSAAKQCAWDCGTGNGQAAAELAGYFAQVFATDPSERQLAAATPHPHVQYLVATAEDSKLAAHSVDLTTVAQAFHWFKHPLFFDEVRRVSKPGAGLALWTYELCHIDAAVDAIVLDYYRNIVGRYWEPERKLVETGYKTVDVPFEEVAVAPFAMHAQWSLAHLLGYLGTWSATQAMIRDVKHNPLEDLAPRLAQVWGESQASRAVSWQLGIRVFRVSAPKLI